MLGQREKDEAPRKENTGIVTIIAALIVLVGTIYASQTEMRIQNPSNNTIYMRNLENAYEQKFYMSEEMITRAGIEHIRYEIEAEPAINGFHIIPYVYIEIEILGEKKYIPVEGQFLQKEYVAGQDGRCTLYRENTKKELLDKLKELGCEVQVECMIAIEYVVESKPDTAAISALWQRRLLGMPKTRLTTPTNMKKSGENFHIFTAIMRRFCTISADCARIMGKPLLKCVKNMPADVLWVKQKKNAVHLVVLYLKS